MLGMSEVYGLFTFLISVAYKCPKEWESDPAFGTYNLATINGFAVGNIEAPLTI